MMKDTIGKRIMELREQKDWSPTKLATIMHTNNKTIVRWEHDLTIPCLENIMRLAELFDVSTDYILCREDKPQPGFRESQQSMLKFFSDFFTLMEKYGLSDEYESWKQNEQNNPHEY